MKRKRRRFSREFKISVLREIVHYRSKIKKSSFSTSRLFFLLGFFDRLIYQNRTFRITYINDQKRKE